MMARSIRSPFTAVDRLAGGLGRRDLELVVEPELFGERVAQVLIVVDDEDDGWHSTLRTLNSVETLGRTS